MKILLLLKIHLENFTLDELQKDLDVVCLILMVIKILNGLRASIILIENLEIYLQVQVFENLYCSHPVANLFSLSRINPTEWNL